MVYQMAQLSWTNYVAVTHLLPSSQARINWGLSRIIFFLELKRMKNAFFSPLSIRFHSDKSGNEKGFLIEYSIHEQFTTCGGTFSNGSGILSSPSYPNAYPELADCHYLVSQPKGAYVNISFIKMDIDCQGTPSDYIELRDGKTEKSPLMGKLCGNGSNISPFIQTSQNHLRIR